MKQGKATRAGKGPPRVVRARNANQSCAEFVFCIRFSAVFPVDRAVEDARRTSGKRSTWQRASLNKRCNCIPAHSHPTLTNTLMAGIYSINSPQRLFEKLARDYAAFCAAPTEDGLWIVLFLLYHLREWICPGGYESYQRKPECDRSREEIFHGKVYCIPEHQVVRSLCNGFKHCKLEPLAGRTQAVQGFRVGLGRMGDSLGVTHFMVDGQDIRDIFGPVYNACLEFFTMDKS